MSATPVCVKNACCARMRAIIVRHTVEPGISGQWPFILISANLINNTRLCYSIICRRRRRDIRCNPLSHYVFHGTRTENPSSVKRRNVRGGKHAVPRASDDVFFFFVSYQFQRRSTRKPPTTFPACSGWRRLCSQDQGDGSPWKSQRPPAAGTRTRTIKSEFFWNWCLLN